MRRFPNLRSPSSLRGFASKTSRTPDVLKSLSEFGHNPGALGARYFVPQALKPGAPLVVVLHGCTQTADQYDYGAGWSEAADDYGFALLLPEQQRSNNPNLCFNWFLPQDARRDRGEALSIRNMIAAMVETHKLDPRRIYVTGLSAGGAMANVLLATYPELFAGGAIIAGLPYGTATDVPQALERMRGQGLPSEREVGAFVIRATEHQGPWPIVSVWHGSADATVYPSNADATVAQWSAIHGLAREPSRRDRVDGCSRQTWSDARGRDIVELITIPGMGHGTPLAIEGPDACGSVGPYMLDRQISSTRHICRFWGIADGLEASIAPDQRSADLLPAPAASLVRTYPKVGHPPVTDLMIASPPSGASGVGKVIEDALRAAGLMR